MEWLHSGLMMAHNRLFERRLSFEPTGPRRKEAPALTCTSLPI